MALQGRKSSTEIQKKSDSESHVMGHPSIFDKLLSQDLYFSSLITIEGRPRTASIKISRIILKFLEVTGHGVPWLAVSAYYGYKYTEYLQEFSFNLLVALLLDLAVVCTLKVLTGRQRPSHNQDDMFATVSVDKYSFPSGHATRVSMVATLFSFSGFDPTYLALINLWAVVVAISRIVLGRHHISDVVAGVVIGVLDAWIIMTYCWVDAQTISTLISRIDNLMFV